MNGNDLTQIHHLIAQLTNKKSRTPPPFCPQLSDEGDPVLHQEEGEQVPHRHKTAQQDSQTPVLSEQLHEGTDQDHQPRSRHRQQGRRDSQRKDHQVRPGRKRIRGIFFFTLLS